jgi:hypothetical protein
MPLVNPFYYHKEETMYFYWNEGVWVVYDFSHGLTSLPYITRSKEVANDN